MAQEAAVSDRLRSLAGLFEKFRESGRTFDGPEAAFVADELVACAERARENEQEGHLLFRSLQASQRARLVPSAIIRRALAILEGACA